MRNKRKKKRVLFRGVFLLAIFSIAALAGLGYFRFKAKGLERRLSVINETINSYAAEEAQLDSTLKGLISPIKLYSHCKDILGMQAGRPEAVYMPPALLAAAKVDKPQKEWRSSLFAFFGFTITK